MTRLGAAAVVYCAAGTAVLAAAGDWPAAAVPAAVGSVVLAGEVSLP